MALLRTRQRAMAGVTRLSTSTHSNSVEPGATRSHVSGCQARWHAPKTRDSGFALQCRLKLTSLQFAHFIHPGALFITDRLRSQTSLVRNCKPRPI